MSQISQTYFTNLWVAHLGAFQSLLVMGVHLRQLRNLWMVCNLWLIPMIYRAFMTVEAKQRLQAV